MKGYAGLETKLIKNFMSQEFNAPLKIVIFTIGSRGDVQPYIALGCGLKADGFDVSIATYSYFKPFIEAYGLKLKPLTGDPKAMLATKEGQKWLQSHQNPLQFIQSFIALTQPRIEPLMRETLLALADADLIIYSDLGIVGYHVAESLNIPVIETHLQPFGATTEFASVGAPAGLKFGGWYNWLTHKLTEQILWQPFRSKINSLRETLLDLPPESFWGPFNKIEKRQHPTLYAFSRHIIPKPKDWPSWRHITGYWFLPPPPKWSPEPQLKAFLEAGESPLYVGFGSMLDENPKELVDLILTAVSNSTEPPPRLLLSSGWANLVPSKLPSNVHVTKAVPHEWLFPQMAAVVHHGGAGTAAAALRSGSPSAAIPYFADQFFWANRVYQQGVGPKPVSRPKLTVNKLASIFSELMQNNIMKQRAADLGKKIQAESGVETAVFHIRQYIEKNIR